MERVAVVGAPGSGKTTTSAAIAGRLDLVHVELDELWWEPGWTEASPEAFSHRVEGAMAPGRWVLDGFYIDEVGRSLVWPRADTVVWLDLPRHTCVRRTLARTSRRVILREQLWSGNRESLINLSPASVGRFIRTWPRYPARLQAEWGDPAWSYLRRVRLCTPVAVTRWLETLP